MKEDTDNKSKILLSPEVRRIKSAIIKKFAEEPLDVMSKFVKEIVDTENDTIKRLGAMAARVEILRMRISEISNKKVEKEDYLTSIEEEEINTEKNEVLSKDEENNLLSDWVRLRIDENSEINGVRFPKGVVIDVSKEDADKLIQHQKASYVKEKEEEAVAKKEVSNEEVEKEKESLVEKEVSTKEVEEEGTVVEKEEGNTGNEEKEVSTKEVKNKQESITKKEEETAEVKDDENSETFKEELKLKQEKKKPSPEELLAGFKIDDKK